MMVEMMIANDMGTSRSRRSMSVPNLIYKGVSGTKLGMALHKSLNCSFRDMEPWPVNSTLFIPNMLEMKESGTWTMVSDGN